MGRPAITGELVRGVWRHLGAAYGTTTVRKEHSPLMRAAGEALQAVRILDQRRFMEGFTTVVGHRIYAPFTPGVAEGMSLLAQLDTGIHEHQHVVQLEREGRARFWGRYLASSRARALYEAEAYTCGIELHWWLYERHPRPVDLARVLDSYGCTRSDVAAAVEVLERNADMVRAGRPVTEAFQVAMDFLARA